MEDGLWRTNGEVESWRLLYWLPFPFFVLLSIVNYQLSIIEYAHYIWGRIRSAFWKLANKPPLSVNFILASTSYKLVWLVDTRHPSEVLRQNEKLYIWHRIKLQCIAIIERRLWADGMLFSPSSLIKKTISLVAWNLLNMFKFSFLKMLCWCLNNRFICEVIPIWIFVLDSEVHFPIWRFNKKETQFSEQVTQ